MFPGSKYDNIEITLTPEGRSVLSLSKVQRVDSGKIIVCSAVNSVGSVSSRVVLAINTQDDRPPPIILHGPSNQTLPLKSMAVLPCRAIGTPTPVVSWYRDGIPVPQSSRVNISESGTLTLTDLNKDQDQGLYTCVASSRSGKSTWSAYLKLEVPTNPNIKFFRAPEATTHPSPPGLLYLFFLLPSRSSAFICHYKLTAVVGRCVCRIRNPFYCIYASWPHF